MTDALIFDLFNPDILLICRILGLFWLPSVERRLWLYAGSRVDLICEARQLAAGNWRLAFGSFCQICVSYVIILVIRLIIHLILTSFHTLLLFFISIIIRPLLICY